MTLSRDTTLAVAYIITGQRPPFPITDQMMRELKAWAKRKPKKRKVKRA